MKEILIFPNSNNNVIYADIKKGKDIIRVYNMHLQSIKISPDVNEISENIDSINQQKSQVVIRRISKAFTNNNNSRPRFLWNIKKTVNILLLFVEI